MKMIAGLLQLTHVLVFLGTCHAITEFNLFHHCGKPISMIRNDIKDALLFYVDDSKYTDGSNPCIVELWGWFENDVAMQFRSLSWTYNTYIEIRQGDDWDTARPIAGLPKILNSTFNQLNQVYTSDWLGIFIAIHNPPARYGPRLFELALNVFHSGGCEKWEYRCDNGWCIDEDLKCNGNNPCGDNSDCGPEGPSSGIIAVICVSTISGASCILVIVYYVVRHYVKKRRRLQTAVRFQDEAARTNNFSSSRQNDEQEADTDHSYGYHVHSRWNNNDASLNNLFDDEHSSRSQRTNRMEPPNYNSITTDNNMSNNTSNGTNRPNPPDYNTAVMGSDTSDRLGPEPSAPRMDTGPSAPRLDTGPSAPRLNTGRSAPRLDTGPSETSDLPSYNDVLQNEDAYRVNLPGDRTVVYRV